MSAWLLSAAHINALVQIIEHGPDGGGWEEPLRLAPPFPAGAVDAGLVAPDGTITSDLTRLGQDLWSENYKSVNWRYSEHQRTPRFSPWEMTRRPTAVEALKLVACYDYQTCEHPEWNDSVAYAITVAVDRALSVRLCRRADDRAYDSLPGWAAAPWGWDQPRRARAPRAV